MLEILSIDDLEIIRWFVFALFIVSAICVTAGVYWEKEEFPHAVRHFGWKLLVWSLGAEILLTIGVFVIDGTISTRQRHTIEQLLTARQLSASQKERLIAVTKKFPSLNFITFTVQEDEPFGFGIQIGKFLRDNGWNWIPCDGPFRKVQSPYPGSPPFCLTILAGIQIEGSQDRQEVADALVEAFKDPNVIGMENVRFEKSEAYPTIAIMIGTKR